MVYHFLQQKHPSKPVPLLGTVQEAATWGKPTGSKGYRLALCHQMQQVECRHHCDIFTNKTRGKEQGQELSRRKKKKIKTSQMLNTFIAQLMTWTHIHSANKFQIPIFQMVSLLWTQVYLYIINKIYTI